MFYVYTMSRLGLVTIDAFVLLDDLDINQTFSAAGLIVDGFNKFAYLVVYYVYHNWCLTWKYAVVISLVVGNLINYSICGDSQPFVAICGHSLKTPRTCTIHNLTHT